jgi:phage anti-repressor protein
MNELIKITEDHTGSKLVSAKDLYDFLEIKRDFSNWFKQMAEYGFQEGKEFTPILAKTSPLGGRPSIDYALTIDTAKEIAMIQRSDKGKQARQYFIECEKKLKQAVAPLDTLDILELSLQEMRKQKLQLQSIQKDVEELKAAKITRPDYFTVVGYATIKGFSVGLGTASMIGIKASRICKDRNLETEEIPDPRFGKVKSYPRFILDEVCEALVINLPLSKAK